MSHEFSKILVIEADSLVREKFTSIFLSQKKTKKTTQSLDFTYAGDFSKDKQVYFSDSEQEGIALIQNMQKEGGSFSIVFMELGDSPECQGIETALEVWQIDAEIQVVLCISDTQVSLDEACERLGQHDNLLLLRKPIDKIIVRQLISTLMKKWQLAKEAKTYNELFNRTLEERTESLTQSLSLLRATIESASDGILVLDLEGNIVDYNHNFMKMWNIPESVMIQRDGDFLWTLIDEKLHDSEIFKKKIKSLKRHPKVSSQQIIKLIDQKIYECASQPHRLNGVIIGRVWSFHDITEQSWIQEKLEYQASHDVLTNLPNRVLLYDRIEQAIAQANRQKTNFAVIFLDVDRFKLINDSLSHEIGDELLREISKRLLNLMRKEDTLARLGGDEFVIVVPELAKEGYMVNVAQKILQSFEKPFKISKRELILGASIGISLFPADGTHLKSLLRNADLAMYQAKERGGNQFRFYTSSLNKQSRVRLSLESELRRAIRDQEFFLLYQPQCRITDGKIVGAEALLRWQHPKKGVILPVDFIPIAEESGLIVPLGEWVLNEVCQQIIAWRKAGLPYIRIAINIALNQLRQYYFSEHVSGILSKYKIPEEYIEFEIAENMVIAHPELLKTLQAIKKTGVSIGLDDFGLNSSSLSYLKKLPADRVKMERSLVANISVMKNDEAILIGIMEMAKRLSIAVVAKGVEKPYQIEFLKRWQCDEVQGFYFSEPLTEEEIQVFHHKQLGEVQHDTLKKSHHRLSATLKKSQKTISKP